MSEIEIGFGGEDNGLEASLLAVQAVLTSLDATLSAIDQTIAQVGDQLDGLADDAKETGETLDDAGESGDGFAIKLVAVEAAVSLAERALGGLLDIGGQLIEWSEQAREAFDEQDVVNRRLYTTLLRSGEAAESFAEKQAILAQVSANTGIGDEALSAGLEKYIRLTGDATGSAEDLALITDIMAGADRDATAAAELLARAQNGKLEGLEDVLPLTKDEIDALNRIEDGNKRSAIAVDLLTQQYGGQAQQVAASTLAKNNLTNASGDLLQMVGSLIDASGVYTAVLGPMTGGLREGEAALADNSVQAQHLLINGVLKLVDGALALNTVMLDNAEFIGGATVSAELLGKTFLILIDTVQLIGRAIGSLLSGTLAALISGFEEAALFAADLARAAGQDGLANELEFGARAAGHLSDELEQVAKSNLDGAIEEAKEMDATFGSMADTIATTDQRIDLARQTLTKTGEVIKEMKDNLETAGENVQALDPTRSARRGGDIGEVDKSEAEKAAAREKAKRDQERADKLALREIDLQLVELRSELVSAQVAGAAEAQIQLTYQVAELEAARATIGVKDAELAAAQENLALLEAEAERIESITDLEAERADAAEAERKKQREHEEELAELARERLEQQLEWTRQIADTLSGVNADVDPITDTADAWALVTGRLGGVAEAMLEVHAAEDLMGKGAAASASAISAIASATAGLASVNAASAKERAIIETKINAAAAAAAFGAWAYTGFAAAPFGIAFGNHSAAAIQYGVIAGTTPDLPSGATGGGGGGGGGGANLSGGGGGSGGGFAGFDFARERVAQAEAIAEAIAATDRSGMGTQVIIDARGMRLLSDDPDDLRRMAEELADSMREVL